MSVGVRNMIINVKEIGESELESVIEIVFSTIDDCHEYERKYVVESDKNNEALSVVTLVEGNISFHEDGTIEDYKELMDEIGQCFAVWNAMRAFGEHPNAPKPYMLKRG